VTDTIVASDSSETGASPNPGLPARIIGVLTAPRRTYAAVAARPHWFGVLAFVVLVGGGALFTLLSTEVGKQAMLDQQVKMMESFGLKMTDAQYQQLEDRSKYAPYTSVAGQAVALPLMGLVLAGIALGVFNAVLGGNASFKQTYAVVAHSAVVLTVAQLFGLPLAYARGTLSGTTNLGVFVPFLDDTSFVARFLGSIDLFYVWWMVSLSIGLGVLYRRRTGPIAASVLVVYVVIALVIAAVRSAVAGA
jgi:hypothetical protein